MRRIPQLALVGLVATCGVLASCGEPAQNLPRGDSAVPAPTSSAPHDFSKPGPANQAASVVANALAPRLKDESNYVGLRITADGVEVILSGPPTASEVEAVNATKGATPTLLAAGHADPSIPVPIAVRTVAHSLSELLALTHRLQTDTASWAARGITFSSFGPDIVQDVVVLHLQNYSPASAAELEKAYGPLLVVATENQTVSAS
ncbi:hypothetical protein [Sinomonas sp. P47F7]|uniref:hypothetical protein n=1 Tax=Sinomonas sp. P47F7 TaxID=3410987 RepID=UPI003BF4B883